MCVCVKSGYRASRCRRVRGRAFTSVFFFTESRTRDASAARPLNTRYPFDQLQPVVQLLAQFGLGIWKENDVNNTGLLKPVI